MIRPNKYLERIERERQHFDQRDGVLRLDMNEYVPCLNEMLYEEWKREMTGEILSAYPLVNSAYHSISKLTGLKEEQIVLTAGSDGVVLSTLLAFTEPGDLIGMVVPTYGMYSVYAAMLGLRTKEVSYDGFFLDQRELLESITAEMKVFLLANPNGVVGDDLPREDILKLLDKTRDCGTVLLLDEVYAAFLDEGYSRYADVIDEYDNLIIARSFSKSYGLAGLRVGYSVSCANTRKYLLAVRTNVEINSAAVTAINVWCRHPELLKRGIHEIIKSKEMVTKKLQELGICTINGRGNFVLALIPSNMMNAFKRSFEHEKIAVKWISIKEENWIRITVGTMDYMRKFIVTVRKIVRLSNGKLYE